MTQGDEISLIRFSKDGKIDNTFAGNTGKITAPAGLDYSDFTSMLKDGSILVRGSNEVGNSIIARYSKAGVLVTSFGSGGILTLPEGVKYPWISEQADGKLRLSGDLMEQGEFGDDWLGSYLAQYTATGQLDATFGVGGVLTAPAGGTIQNWQTATDGSIYASMTQGDEISFIRFFKDGKIDMTFAGDTVGDTLIGNNGDDTLVSGVAVSSLVGGAGDDVYYVNNALTVVVDASGESDEIIASTSYDLSKNNSIEKLAFANGIGGANLVGNSLANTITGDAANDTLNGGTGADAMVGGAGNDLYIVDNAGDTI
jgi:Ca2+-binding RTX toxin-like protein